MQAEKLRWWSIYREPEHELVGKIQLYVNYSASTDDSQPKVYYYRFPFSSLDRLPLAT